MQDPLGTTVVFRDLHDAYREMMNGRRFPAKFRRAFDEYVYRSQQLTEVMRKEYSAQTGRPWNASGFTGWNDFTDALKALRRNTYHGVPLVLYETTLAVYPAVQFVTDEAPIGPRQSAAGVRLIHGTLFITSPFREKILMPSMAVPAKDGSGLVRPLKEFVSYQLRWHVLDSSAKASLQRVNTTDVIRIVANSFPVYKRYFAYYEAALSASGR